MQENFPEDKIVLTQNGKDCFQKASLQQFDLLITDLSMPKMDGNELLKNINSLTFDLQPKAIIVLSGNLKTVTTKSKIKNTVYMPKPFQLKPFLRHVNRAFGIDTGEADESGQKMSVEFINPFIDSTLKVLETMCFTKAEKDAVFVRQDDQLSGDISALVAMISKEFSGSMAIAFEKKCFLSIVSLMLGETYTEINEEIEDAAGELCNQIYGGRLSDSQ